MASRMGGTLLSPVSWFAWRRAESRGKKIRFFRKNQLRRQLTCLISRSFMRNLPPTSLAIAVSSILVASVIPGFAAARKSTFVFKDRHGRTQSVEIITKYQKKKIVHPFAKVDPGIDPRLRRAATIAQDRAHAHSRSQCWHAVKEALVASGAIRSYPTTVYAKQAGQELVHKYGFKRLKVRDPFKAPVGAVLVYGASRAPGHVEIRTRDGFVSDFRSKTPSPRPLIGVYAKS
jgi:hypothetical protein